MSYGLDDIFDGLGNGGGKAPYTLEEIEAAKKRQKKHGGTIMENLEAILSEKSGQAPSSSGASPMASPMTSMETALKSMQESSEKARAAQAALEKASAQTAADIQASIRELTSSLANDFPAPGKTGGGGTQASASLGSDPSTRQDQSSQDPADRKNASQNVSDPMGQGTAVSGAQDPALQEQSLPEGPVQILERFSGLSGVLAEKVLGQEEFLKKLVIAFKRPYVSERDHNDALNSIYVTGPACTGKHCALSAMAEELCARQILKSAELCTIDLSLYPNASEEKLFLQDLYAALQSASSILVFEHIEDCHISLLTRLSDLVSTGECKLSDRYVLQNGQLIHVANAFAGNTVGSFEAKGKYLVFVSEMPLDKLADVMGAPFVNALGDICATAALSEETIQKIARKREDLLIEKCRRQLAFELTIDDSFRSYLLNQASRGRALRGVLEAFDDTQRALTELRLERDDLPSSSLTLTCGEEEPKVLAGEEAIPLKSLLPGGYNGELDKVKAELDSIVGLKEVKEYIFSLEEYFGVQKRRREAGLKAGEVNKHMIFTGNPGTGKTTIARIVSKYLKAIGVLSGGQLVEVSRADLVGRYVGHTAPLVNQVIKSAIGGVLFIDEAYSLHRGNEDSFGLEAIDTLVKGIEDNRDDLIVILAGYSNEMEEFLEANSGLKSRFPNIIDFPDYTGEELLAIGEITAKSKGYVIDEAAKKPLLDYFNRIQETRARDAGNGRLVRNKLEEAILNQSRRLVAEPEADMSLLLETDFELED